MVNPERLRKFLPGEVLLVGEVAEDMGIRAYIVGGTVRDIVLGRENIDIDIVVEGDYLELSERLKGYGFEARSKTPLRTLKLKKGSLVMDLAGTRKEFYPKPGALPRVEPGNLMEDLARRDFTINSIACSINPSNFGELFDPFEGIGDIGRRVIRVDEIDGVKFRFEDGSWLLFRLSGTEPVVRVYSEGKSPEEVDELLHEGRRILGL